MANDDVGWANVQCGYWAAIYSLFFQTKSGAAGSSQVHARMAEMVMLLGLARLFQQDGDALRLSELITEHFSWDEAIGNRVRSGQRILHSILEPGAEVAYDDLIKDRKESCQKRDTWPTRPTSFDPFCVLDIEIMLRFPDKAAFHYSGGFAPTDEDHITQAIVAYHSWYERPKRNPEF